MNSSFKPGSQLQQRGVIMVVALVTLVVLMIGAVAMIRSMSSSLVAAGNFGFKRDMSNQGIRALTAVQTLITSGALSTPAARQTSNLALNYSATMLATTPEGIPTALLTDTAFASVATGADIQQSDMGINVRYVVDRLCAVTGPVTKENCMLGSQPPPAGGSGSMNMQGGGAAAAAIIPQAVYRITVRVSGPRQTQSFFQATLTV